jgi:hypothetical protein
MTCSLRKAAFEREKRKYRTQPAPSIFEPVTATVPDH